MLVSDCMRALELSLVDYVCVCMHVCMFAFVPVDYILVPVCYAMCSDGVSCLRLIAFPFAPVLLYQVTCNKQDDPSAAGVAQIQTRLEDEL